MAPLFSLLAFAALALFSNVVASPHIARHALDHRHNAIVNRAQIEPLPLRKRSLNRRCAPSTNSTTSPIPSSTPSYAPSSVPPASSVPPVSSVPPASSAPPPSSAPPSQTSSPTSAPSPTSTPASVPTSSPPPTTSSTSTSSSAAPAQTYSSSSNTAEPSYLTGTQSGQGTWFDVGLGACGETSNNNQNIVAVSESIFDSYPGYDGVNPNTNPVCGKGITITYNGASVEVTVVDRCTGCAELDLDMAPSAFGALAALGVGRIDMKWKWT